MSKRRGAGAQPQLAPASGAQWRQKQELAALAAALRALPQGTAAPARLLWGLRRALLCARHVLDAHTKQQQQQQRQRQQQQQQEASHEGAGAARSVGSAADGAATEAGLLVDEARAVDAAAHAVAPQLRALLADPCVVPAPVTAGGQRAPTANLGDVGVGGGQGSTTGWRAARYAAALLHHLLALACGALGSAQAPGAEPCALAPPAEVAPNAERHIQHARGERWSLCADALALLPQLPSRQLGLALYGRLAGALCWEAYAVDILAWLPDSEAAGAAAERILHVCPSVATELAGVIRGSEGRSAGGACRPAARLGQLARSARVLAALAHCVRTAAAAAPAATAGGSLAPSRWVPCLLLLAQALRERLSSAAAADDDDGEWLVGCAAALEDGLCAWQGEVLVATASVPWPSGGGCKVTDTANAAHELPRLLGQLDSQLAVPHRASTAQPAPGRPREVLPFAACVRLRSRIALLRMAASAAASEPVPQSAAEPPSHARGGARGAMATELSADDVWARLVPSRTPNAGPAGGAGSGPVLPGWLQAAAAPVLPTHSGGEQLGPPEPPCALQRQLRATTAAALGLPPAYRLAAALSQSNNADGAGTSGGASQDASGAPTERVAAVVMALLTPGVPSWIVLHRSPRLAAVAGPNPYNPLCVSLALLELMEGCGVCDGTPAVPAPAAGCGAAGHGKGGEQASQLALRVLRMAAQCMAHVTPPEQQAALQALAAGGGGAGGALPRLRSWLARDGALQGAAARALVSLSNRAAAGEGGLECLALGAAGEAQRLAAAATELLPYAVLVPQTLVRRLLVDGLLHAGQQPWVLRLTRAFAVVATAPPPPPLLQPLLQPRAEARLAAAAPAGRGSGAAPSTLLLPALQEVLFGRDPARRVRLAAPERRALRSLLAGLAEAGLLAPRHVLSDLALPMLPDSGGGSGGGNGAGCGASGGAEGEASSGEQRDEQVQLALLLVQHVLGGSGPAAPLALNPAAELAAAQPARLLLGVASALRLRYDEYDKGGQLDPAAMDAAAALLERAVDLFGDHARAVRQGGAAAAAAAAGVQREVRALAAECETLPRRLVAALLPVLELPPPAAAGGGSGEEAELGEGVQDDEQSAFAALRRDLAARLLPPAAWRPRSLRSADGRTAGAVLYDALSFAASAAGHAAAVRRALLEAVAEQEGEAAATAAAAQREEDRAAVAEEEGAWAAWSDGAAGTGAGPAAAGAAVGAVAHHAAATVARGVPQLPRAAAAEGVVAALASLLPVASTEQARRVMLAALPALVRACGGAPVLAPLLGAPGAAAEPAAAGGSALGMFDAVFAPGRSALAGARVDGGADLAGRGTAADVAVVLAVSCRAVARALQGTVTSGSADAASALIAPRAAAASAAEREPGPQLSRSGASAQRLSDHLAAHLALLASSLATMPGAASAGGPAPARGAPPSALSAPGGLAATAAVAAIAGTLLTELCHAVRAAVAASPVPLGLDVWQAVLLSTLQHFVAALGNAGAALLADEAAAGGSAAGGGSGNLGSVGARGLVARALAAAHGSLRALPATLYGRMWAALEHMCEEQAEWLGELAAARGMEPCEGHAA